MRRPCAVSCKPSSTRPQMCSANTFRKRKREPGHGRGHPPVQTPALSGIHRPAVLHQTRTALGAMVRGPALQNPALSLDGRKTRQRQNRLGMDTRGAHARSGGRIEKLSEKHQGNFRRTRIPEPLVLRTLLPPTSGIIAFRIQTAEKEHEITRSTAIPLSRTVPNSIRSSGRSVPYATIFVRFVLSVRFGYSPVKIGHPV